MERAGRRVTGVETADPITVSGRSSLEVAGRPCSATKRSRWPCPLRSAAPSHARPMVPAQAVNGWRDDGQLGPGLLNHPGPTAVSYPTLAYLLEVRMGLQFGVLDSSVAGAVLAALFGVACVASTSQSSG